MTLGSILLSANNMMIDESRKIYRTNKNLGPTWELEATIKLKYSSIETLKGFSSNKTHVYPVPCEPDRALESV